MVLAPQLISNLLLVFEICMRMDDVERGVFSRHSRLSSDIANRWRHILRQRFERQSLTFLAESPSPKDGRECLMKQSSLFQVYLASLAQLLVVLLIVTGLTEVKEVRDFQRRNNWIWALASGKIET